MPAHHLFDAIRPVLRRPWCCLWWCPSILVALCSAPAGAVDPHAALTSEERATLQRRVHDIPWLAAGDAPIRPRDATGQRRSVSTPHPLGVQTVLITLHQGKRARPDTPRIARVFQFDHTGARARRLDLALPEQRLLLDTPVSSVHLPLSEAERHWARGRIAGTVAATPSDGGQRWSAFVHEPLHEDDPCRRERCALISRHGADGLVLAAESIVHFGDGRVRRLTASTPRLTLRRTEPAAVTAAASAPALAAQSDIAQPADGCGADLRIALNHASGAAWSLCAAIDPVAGLRLRHIAYRAPGDRLRPVLHELHPAAVRLQAHRSARPSDLLPRMRPRPAHRCPDDARTLIDSAALCLSHRSDGLLYRYGDISGGQAERHDLDLLQRAGDGTTLRTRVSFGETGTLRPSLSVIAARSRLPAGDSSVQATWRMAFALDSAAPDRVEELDFELLSERGSRRVMRVRPLATETRRAVAHERFRGWRVIDATGAGYYLDSQQALGSWDTPTGAPAPRLALSAHAPHERDAARLPSYLDDESLSGRSPVLWYTTADVLMPASHVWDAVSMSSGFVLSPFDWTERSPFAPPEGS